MAVSPEAMRSRYILSRSSRAIDKKPHDLRGSLAPLGIVSLSEGG